MKVVILPRPVYDLIHSPAVERSGVRRVTMLSDDELLCTSTGGRWRCVAAVERRFVGLRRWPSAVSEPPPPPPPAVPPFTSR